MAETCERHYVSDLVDGFVQRLSLVELMLLYALVKQVPDLLTVSIAHNIVALAEVEALADECRGKEDERY